MKATLKVDVIDRYKEPRKIEVPMTAAERKAYRKIHKDAEEEDLVKVQLMPIYYGKVGDEVTIVSQDPGAWKIVVVVETKNKETFAIRWDDLNTQTNEEKTSTPTK